MNEKFPVKIKTAGGDIDLDLSISEAERFRNEYTAWLASPEPHAVFHLADEHKDKFVRLDSILYCEITGQKRKATFGVA